MGKPKRCVLWRKRRFVRRIKFIITVRTHFLLEWHVSQECERHLLKRLAEQLKWHASTTCTHCPTSSLTSSDQHYQEWWRTLYASDLKWLLLSLVPTESDHKTGGQLLYRIWHGIKALWRGNRAPRQYTTWEAWTSPRLLLEQIVRPLDCQTAFVSRGSSCHQLIQRFLRLAQMAFTRLHRFRRISDFM